jgi:ATP-dependent DNA helicase RecG
VSGDPRQARGRREAAPAPGAHAAGREAPSEGAGARPAARVQHSGFAAAIEAVRAPLAFASEHADALARAPTLGASVLAALARAAELAIPPEARRRLEQARALVTADAGAEAFGRVARLLAPLLEPDWPARALAQPAERLPGVGPKLAALLARRGIRTLEDLLFFLPRAYEDRRRVAPIETLEVGHPACFEGRVVRAGVVPLSRGRRFFQAVVADGTGAVQLKWFRGIPQFEKRIVPGARVLVAGDVRRYRFSKELHHPDVEVLSDATSVESLARIVPLYAGIEGIAPRTLRRIAQSAAAACSDLAEELLPEGFARELGLPGVGEALRQVHAPTPALDPEELRARRTRYHRRLAAEELFALCVGLERLRERRAERASKPLDPDHPDVARALASLPFELTADQRRAWAEIAGDLRRGQPMSRLLVGDVGTGKTVLAFLACVAARASGGLAAVLAPTEILAEQHLRTFRALAKPLGLRVALVTGSTPPAERRSAERLLRLREVAILLGTHALLADDAPLPELRLVVIDEQHRFGVVQRQALERRGEAPHALVMTATPIPRTLALTVFGDLDQSVLRELPRGRRPVTTRVVPRSAGRAVLAELQRTIARGEQAFVVYPLVEESEKQDLLDATRGFERLRAHLPGRRVALVHGRLDPAERQQVMERFARGEIDVLVATTVIEVGVDVPNATLLVVQHAERFGLAQLHQLRGRVGRGSAPGRAILIGEPTSEDASRRLAILEGSASGFDIAEEDLRIRGPGQWLGTRQTGFLAELRLADLVRDADLVARAREAAQRLVRHDPALVRHPELRSAIERRWGERLGFAHVA